MKKSLVIGGSVVIGVVVISSLAIIGLLAQSGDGVGLVDGLLGRPRQMASANVASAQDKVMRPTFLTCSAVKDRTRDFLKLHYSFRSFTEDLSSRVFNKFFQTLDPGKSFFLAEDIERLRQHEKTLPISLARVDCRFINEVHALFLQRVKESEAYVDEAVSKAFDFSVDESVETDRKKISWAKDAAELKDRWRKQFKFLALSMKESEPKQDVIAQKLKKRQALMRKAADDRTLDEVNGLFLDAFALSLDPHSQFQMPADQDEFKVAFSLQLVGIGAQLTSSDGYTVVEAIIPGGPASRDGRLQKGDKIIAVDAGDGNGSTNVVDMELPKVVQLIRGKKDTVVKLTLLRKDEKGEVAKIILELIRDVVNLPDGAAKSDVMEIAGKKVGVINLPSFYIDYQGSRKAQDYRSSANDIAKEILKLTARKVDGIVLDLRRNGGGDLNECIRISGFFVDTGSVVQVQNRNGDIDNFEDKQSGELYKGPLAVLTSKQSASASEILAGALQDWGRALIIGNSRTYGKATVQHVVEVPGTHGRESDGALKVTVSKFFQPSGSSNQFEGIRSEVVIPDALEPVLLGEERNEYALPHSTIAPARGVTPYVAFSPVLEMLRKRSADRIAKSKEFQNLLPLIKKAEKERDNTVFPLKPEAINKLKNDNKKAGGKDKGTPTPTPAPGGDLFTMKVIEKDDIQLFEAGHILLDSVELLGRTDWTK